MDYEKLHKSSFENKKDIQQSSIVGCFYCLNIYHPNEVDEYIVELSGLETTICPHCMIDSVIPLNPEDTPKDHDCILDQLNKIYF